MRRILIACAVAALGIAVPVSASALTLQEVVSLSRAGMSDQVIIAMIQRDRTIFTIGAEDLVALKAAGVSEPVVLAMLRSGREPSTAPAAEAPSAAPEAAEPVLPPPPDIVIVGHGPDVPNGGPASYEAPVVFVPYPVFAPVVVSGARYRDHRGAVVSPGPAGSALPPSPFHVGPELPPSPFHVGPVFPPFGAPAPPPPARHAHRHPKP